MFVSQDFPADGERLLETLPREGRSFMFMAAKPRLAIVLAVSGCFSPKTCFSMLSACS